MCSWREMCQAASDLHNVAYSNLMLVKSRQSNATRTRWTAACIDNEKASQKQMLGRLP